MYLKKEKMKNLLNRITIYALFIVFCVLLAGFNYTIIHNCKYKVTFKANTENDEFKNTKTITITVTRPVTLKRICDFWLKKNDGADLNEDGIVNFLDYAIYTSTKDFN